MCKTQVWWHKCFSEVVLLQAGSQGRVKKGKWNLQGRGEAPLTFKIEVSQLQQHWEACSTQRGRFFRRIRKMLGKAQIYELCTFTGRKSNQ